MPIPIEKVVEGQCYRVSDTVQWRILRYHQGVVTFVLRGQFGWEVLRSQYEAERFAASVESVIDCQTMEVIP